MSSNLTVSHPYLRAVTQDAFRQEALDGVKKGANSLPAYDYSESGLPRPSYAVFSRYNSQPKSTLGCIGKKLSHIPGALFSTVKIPLHLGKALVIDSLTAPCTQKRSFKPDLYRVGRDVQEVKGHLLGLFLSEKWGAYHLAESDFYKQCYSIMEQPYDTKLATPKYEIKPKITDQTVADTPLSEIPKFVKGLDCEQLFHLSFTHEQLKAIPLSELTPHQLNGLFPPLN